MKTLDNNEFSNKKIIFRADLNVPVVNGKITDHSRIDSIIPSIKKLIKGKNKIFLVSHFGRPKGIIDKKLSIAFLCNKLANRLEIPKIHFLETYNNSEIKYKQSEMQNGEVCLLENIRFNKEEENNNLDFSKNLSSNFDIYINDAFSSSHRSHSSIVGIPKFLPSYAGLNFVKEIKNLNNFLNKPKKPNLAIIGGSKISTKIKAINNLINLFDTIVIGGAMANTFLCAENFSIGKSLYEKDFINVAVDILKKAKTTNCKIVLPFDTLCSESLENCSQVLECDINSIPEDKKILDIGEKTISLILDEIIKCNSIIWNGPLGAFETKPFDNSSIKIANYIKKIFKENNIDTLAGGGDTLSVINLAKSKEGFSYLSNAGGAFLEWLEGNKSPGYIALENNKF